MLTVTEFRAKYPNATEEQVALYGQAVAAELARGPVEPEPDLPMPRITVPRTLPEIGKGASSTAPSQMTSPNRYVIRDWNYPLDIPPATAAPDLTSDIRRIVLGRRLSARERAAAERPDMSGDDLLALLAGVPNAREFEALEGD